MHLWTALCNLASAIISLLATDERKAGTHASAAVRLNTSMHDVTDLDNSSSKLSEEGKKKGSSKSPLCMA